MKTYLAALLITTTAILFVSCQREAEETLPVTNSTDSLISKVISLDTTFTSGVDTSQVINFTYDGSRRLTKITNTYYFPGITGPGRLDGYEEWIYNYNGSQTVPYKVFGKYFVFAMPTAIDYDTTYLYYTNGVLSKDSITVGFDDYDVNEFTKLSNTRYKMLQKRSDMMGGQFIDSGYIYVNWVGGNLVQEIDSTWRPMSGSWEVRTSNMTYDNKTHPFKRVAIPHPAPFHIDFPVFGFTELALVTDNNVLSIFSSPATELLFYKYGPTGLPKIITYNSDPDKTFLYYISL